MRSVSSSLAKAALFGIGLTAFGAGTQASQAAQIATSNSYGESATDSLQGIAPIIAHANGDAAALTYYTWDGQTADGPFYRPASALSDSTGVDPGYTPDGQGFLPDENGMTITFDLQGTAADAATRQLDSLTISIANWDRKVFNGGLATSLDGTNFTTISGTDNGGADLSDSTWNNAMTYITYTFGDDEVTNFRFLRVISNKSVTAPNVQPRFYEVDAVVSPVPEPVSVAAMGLGSLGLMLRRRRA